MKMTFVKRGTGRDVRRAQEQFSHPEEAGAMF
jgi:hypothetical protein